MRELKLISPVPPSVNHYLSYRAIIKNGKPMAMSYKTQDATKYKHEFTQYVINEAQKQGWDVPVDKSQHFYVDAVFYFPNTRRDCNNCWKLLLDAITDTQMIWVDDNTVCERAQGIFYDAVNPRIEITIKPVDYIGIFKNAEHLEQFESKCIGCNRYNRNCSILKSAKAGNIKDDIIDGECTAFTRIKEKKNGKEK